MPPLAALAFKIATDPFVGRLAYVRVYSGVLKAGSYVYNSVKGVKERISRLVLMHSNHREEVEELTAGDIGAVVGFKNTITGDTICDEKPKLFLKEWNSLNQLLNKLLKPKTR